MNFPLHKDIQKFCGVNITELFPKLSSGDSEKVLVTWLRNAMGLRPSPYSSIQGALRAKHIVTGDRMDERNAYQWDRLRLNLPFTEDYIASLPRFQKVWVDGGHASELIQYVDDARIVSC